MKIQEHDFKGIFNVSWTNWMYSTIQFSTSA